MPLQFATAPDDGLKVVNARLDLFAHHRSPFIRPHGSDATLVRKQGPGRPKVKNSGVAYAPLETYALSIEAVLPGGEGLAGARRQGFYYVLESQQKHPFGGVQILVDEFGQSSVKDLNFGPYSRRILAALQKQAEATHLHPRHYEARLLRCQPIFFSAIWLKSADVSPDLLVPLGPFKLLPGDPPYAAEGFMLALQQRAEKMQQKMRNMAARLKAGGQSGAAP